MTSQLRNLCGDLEDMSVFKDAVSIQEVRLRLEPACDENDRELARLRAECERLRVIEGNYSDFREEHCKARERWAAECSGLHNSVANAESIATRATLRAEQAERERDSLRAKLGALQGVLFDCWAWFDDHDDRKTSAEIHSALKFVAFPPDAAAKEPTP